MKAKDCDTLGQAITIAQQYKIRSNNVNNNNVYFGSCINKSNNQTYSGQYNRFYGNNQRNHEMYKANNRKTFGADNNSNHNRKKQINEQRSRYARSSHNRNNYRGLRPPVMTQLTRISLNGITESTRSR